MVLACYFALSQQASLPVRPFCSATGSGSPRSRPLLRFWPVTTQLAASTCRYSGLHSPLGLLPPPDQSVQPVSLPVGPPSESARFPLAPRCRSFFNYGCGSSFLVRYVSGGLLFLKPLGTSFTMLPKLFGVNHYCDRLSPFSSGSICIVPNRLRGKLRWFIVHKTNCLRSVLAIVFAILEPKCEG